ncbi:MAG: hypothetical protein O9340_03470 [Cyclobacteriaceae bacterium]|nr:hypothetical protein [Cyclobacteriaceae bacterium]
MIRLYISITFFLVAIGFHNSSGQTLISYTGTFDDGIASYEYYLSETGERMYHGAFTYKSVDDYKKDEIQISGKFKNNLKFGLWKYTFHWKDETVFGHINRGKKIMISGNYENGLLQGNWLYTEIDNATNKMIKKSTIQFKDGVPNNTYSYQDNKIVNQIDYMQNISITGAYNEQGLMHGRWTIKYKINKIDYIDTRLYEEGKIKEHKVINLSTGDKVEPEYDSSSQEQFNFELALSFWQCFDSYTCPETNLIFKYIKRGSNFKYNTND